MKIRLLLIGHILATSLHAQYYYDDIIGVQETNRQMQNYISNKVKSISGTGTDSKGTIENKYSEFYEIKNNGRSLKAAHITGMSKNVVYSHFDDNGRITSREDSSSSILNITSYTYDGSGRIIKIQNTVKDQDNKFNQVETHFWQYNSENSPVKMWRIIDNTGSGMGVDSLEVKFVTDLEGNIGEERTYKKGMETNFLYYYYDDKKRLTDIVRYNKKLRKLIPDVMFEYDDNGRVIQKITTTSDLVVGYLIWRYILDENGLKTKEALFNNDKKMTGKIEYVYSFSK